MLSKGNGAPEICAQNLLKTIRGEVPYERIKGINREIFDAPGEYGANDLTADAEFVIKTYEPRVDIESVEIAVSDGINGNFELTANIKAKD